MSKLNQSLAFQKIAQHRRHSLSSLGVEMTIVENVMGSGKRTVTKHHLSEWHAERLRDFRIHGIIFMHALGED